jgi:hypothetical protein
MTVSHELLDELRALPRDFFGTVEITYQNGVAGLIRVSRTKKLSPPPNGNSLGAGHDHPRQ